MVELLFEEKMIILYLETKQFHIKPENVSLLTGLECILIWTQILKTQFKIGEQTLIMKAILILHDLALCLFQNLNCN